MSWGSLPPDLRAIAEEVCTRKQLDVLKLIAAGASQSEIGTMLEIDKATVRGHRKAAFRRIRKHPGSKDVSYWLEHIEEAA